MNTDQNQNLIHDDIQLHYDDKIRIHGASEMGLSYRTADQHLGRIRRIIENISLLDGDHIADFGCGYGSLFEELSKSSSISFTYTGYDLSREAIELAEQRLGQNHSNSKFVVGSQNAVSPATYIVGSGVFNINFMGKHDAWEDFVFETLDSLYDRAAKGICFNFLSDRADENKKRKDLFYASPTKMLDWGLNKSRSARLVHDYGLYDFLILVDKTRAW